jgi:hypothetical protein
MGGPDMASYRYRARIPAEECSKLGIDGKVNEGQAHILVFSKPMGQDLILAEQARSQGVKIVVDIGDDHFTDRFSELYHGIAKVAHTLVTPTKEMAARLYDYTGRKAEVIPDPYELDLQEPHAQGLNALWFGHNVNLGDLQPWRKWLNGYEIRVVTGPGVVEPQIKWSPDALNEELARANVVLLPTRHGAENRSPNRLLNAIRAGCFPVCSKHPSYDEFKKMVWVGDIRTGLQWAKSQQGMLNGLVKEAQSYIEKYSPQSIGLQWAQFLGSL